MAIKKLGILVGGGPAPGVNGAIAAAALEAMKHGCTAIGIHDGLEWLTQRYTDEKHELTVDEVSRIHFDGGAILGTSRTSVAFNPVALENTIAALKKLEIEALVIIGGDDIVASALAIEHGGVKVVQIPKSVDNDLPLPESVASLGYETARQVGVGIVESLMADAQTTGRWYICATMGRPTGHLTLGIGVAASATCTIIPEEFPKTPISLSDICDIVEGSIIKRRAMGKNHGVILLSEALSELFVQSEVASASRDAQGNVRVSEINLAYKVKTEVTRRLTARDVKVTVVDKTIGYELRCAPPIPYEAELARDLGFAAVRYLQAGGSSAVVTMQDGEFRPVPLSEVLDNSINHGKQRMVDVTTESYLVARDYMVRLNAKDFQDKAWVETLAKAAALEPQAFKEYFAKFAQEK